MDFPAPLTPTRATRSPRLMEKSSPSKTRFPSYSLERPRALRTSQPLSGASGMRNRTSLSGPSSTMGSIFSSRFRRLCTWAALDDL